MANRISLKELSELLAKEVQNGNGDAFIFVGEYYITKDNYTEEIPQSYDVITGAVIDNTKVHEFPYIIYKDNITKEKIMATSYQHVQKLTEEENAELERQLKSDEFKKSYGSKSKKASNRYGSTYTTPEYYTFSGGTGITNRIAIEEDVVAPMGELQINGVEQAPVEMVVNVEQAANVAANDANGEPDHRQNVREYINRLEQEYIRRGRR